eukprot:TRINITY_DN11627_c0_g1_i1.p1 TRINITY_DN11627_c0_g1~~TRINITY_DN11627_c0_g1_i1.p1  ORF type:complete len:102 (+),score=1.85 TRINITY_DN11627_c0_g1_i1:194-499(+)
MVAVWPISLVAGGFLFLMAVIFLVTKSARRKMQKPEGKYIVIPEGRPTRTPRGSFHAHDHRRESIRTTTTTQDILPQYGIQDIAPDVPAPVSQLSHSDRLI